MDSSQAHAMPCQAKSSQSNQNHFESIQFGVKSKEYDGIIKSIGTESARGIRNWCGSSWWLDCGLNYN